MAMPCKVSILALLAFGCTGLSACALEPDGTNYDCDSVCGKLAEKGCTFKSDEGAGGATSHGTTGCEHVCNDALYPVPAGQDCRKAWEAFADCLLGDSQLVCGGYWLDQVQGCDAERLAWDECDGRVCDRRGGFSATGTTSDDRPYTMSYGWLDCDCEAGKASGELTGSTCGGVQCPAACCCGGQLVAGACIDDQCASAEETCQLLQDLPYGLCPGGS